MSDNSQSAGWEFYERHFANARMQSYLAEFDGDQLKARELYDWNVRISSDFWEILGFLEVALRNRIDDRMRIRASAEGSAWILLFETEGHNANGQI